MKRFIGFARVSSREQQREGFSLDIQEESFHAYAKRNNGNVDKMFRIAETATKNEERKVFKEAMAFVRRNASDFDGLLFYKIDRAARNLKDYMLLEEIEEKYNIPFISVTQQVDNSPTGKMVRRTLATIGAFQTEQMSVDIKDGISKRVESGWFPSHCPYGYRNIRIDGRSIVVIHTENSRNVQRTYDLRANHGLTIDEIIKKLYDEGRYYSQSKPKFTPSKIYAMLHDKSYIGFVRYKDEWHSGLQPSIIDKVTWDAVRVSFQEQKYRSHEMAFANQLIICKCCGHPITGEIKEKQTKSGLRQYVYYRCARYQSMGHPRIRLREQEVEVQVRQMLTQFSCSRIDLKQLLVNIAKHRMQHELSSNENRSEVLKRQISLIESQLEELLNLLLSKTISESRYNEKQSELSKRSDLLRAQLTTQQDQGKEVQDIAARAPQVFELIKSDWDTYNHRQKQDILRLLFGGFVLNDKLIETGKKTPFELFQNL